MSKKRTGRRAARRSNERPRRAYSRTSRRLREIERIIVSRHGVIPDVDDAGIYLDQAACCLLNHLWKKTGTKPERAALLERLDLWCERFGPYTSPKLRRDVVRAVLRRPRLDNADDCARRLRLSYAERTRLGITTVGSYDLDKRERRRHYKVRKRERDRLRVAAKRTAAGAVSRAKYLAAHSVSRERPWEMEGVSRATWYRRAMLGDGLVPRPAAETETGVSPTSTSSMLGDGLVSRSRSGRLRTARRPLASTAVTTVRAKRTAARQGRGPYRAATHADDALVAIAA
jgi:hypothetical protein